MADMEIPRITQAEATQTKKLVKNLEALNKSMTFLGDAILGLGGRMPTTPGGPQKRYEKMSLAAQTRARDKAGRFLPRDIKDQIKSAKVTQEKLTGLSKSVKDLDKTTKDKEKREKKESSLLFKTKSLISEYGKIITGIFGDISWITEPFKMVGGLVKKTVDFFTPKRRPPKRSAMLKSNPEAVYIVDELTGKKVKKKGEVFGGGILDALLGGSIGALASRLFPALMTAIPLLAIAGAIVWSVVDGIWAVGQAENWGVSKVAAFMGGFFAGQGKGWNNALAMAGKTGLAGAGIGMLVGGPIGAIVGGLMGAVVGGILGYIGGEKIARFIDKAIRNVSYLFEDAISNISFMFTHIIERFKLIGASKEEIRTWGLKGVERLVKRAKNEAERREREYESAEKELARVGKTRWEMEAKYGKESEQYKEWQARAEDWVRIRDKAKEDYENAVKAEQSIRDEYNKALAGGEIPIYAAFGSSFLMDIVKTAEKVGKETRQYFKDWLKGEGMKGRGQMGIPLPADDFISRPGSPLIKVNPEDTIIGAKEFGNNDETNSILMRVLNVLESIESKTKKETAFIQHTSFQSVFDPSNLMDRLASAII